MGYKEDTFNEYEYLAEAFEDKHDRPPTQEESTELWNEAEERAQSKRDALADMYGVEWHAWKDKQGGAHV